jgi:16S rRNA (adenine(1408)-N(1))-methyltransferase
MVLAIDANARSMADASRRAAAKPSRGGHSNVLFLAEGAERLPDSFDGLADVVTILFPWGSLLRGALGVDHAVATSIARLVAPGRNLSIVLSVVERDRAAIGAERPFGPSDVDAMADAFAPLGLDLTNARRLSPDEIRATGSTWARRLRSDDSRSIYRVELTRRDRLRIDPSRQARSKTSVVAEHADALDLEVGGVASHDDRVVEPRHACDDRVAQVPRARPPESAP